MEKNGYNLSRKRFEFRYSNSHKCKSLHTELYFYMIDLWNRLGQKDIFGLPTQMTMEILGVGSYNTYNKAYLDLIEFGFIKEIEKSKNQHTTRRVAISNIDKATNEALYKATYEATDEAHTKATDTIDKQINKGTKEQINKYIDTEKEKEIFKQEIINFINGKEKRDKLYNRDLRNSFYSYWAEPFVKGKNKGHIRKYGETTRELEQRFDTFLRNTLEPGGDTVDSLKRLYGLK